MYKQLPFSEVLNLSSGLKFRQQNLAIKSIQTVKEAISSAKEQVGAKSQLDLENFDKILHCVQVFEAEIFCQRQEWDALLRVINVRPC